MDNNSIKNQSNQLGSSIKNMSGNQLQTVKRPNTATKAAPNNKKNLKIMKDKEVEKNNNSDQPKKLANEGEDQLQKLEDVGASRNVSIAPQYDIED